MATLNITINSSEAESKLRNLESLANSAAAAGERTRTSFAGIGSGATSASSQISQINTAMDATGRAATAASGSTAMLEKAIKASETMSVKYGDALNTLAVKYGHMDEQVRRWLPTLNQAEEAIRKQSMSMDEHGKKGQLFYETANRNAIMQAELANKIKFTSDGFQILKDKVTSSTPTLTLYETALKNSTAISSKYGDALTTLGVRFGTTDAATQRWLPSLNAAESAIRKQSMAMDAAGKAGKDFYNTTDRIGYMNNLLSGSLDKTTSGLIGMIPRVAAVTASYMAMRAALSGVIGIASEFGNFDYEMARVSAATNATKEELKALETAARSAAKGSVFLASEGAEALKQLAYAGLSAKDAMTALPAVIKIATIEQMGLGKATEYVVGILNAFSMPVAEVSRVTDVLSMASRKTLTTLNELGQAMKYAGPIASQLGYTIEETTAMLGTMAQENIRGGQAGRVLQQSLVKTSAAAKELGMDAGSSLIEVLSELERRQIAVTDITKMFGLVALKGVLALKSNVAANNELKESLDGVKGSTDEAVERTENALIPQLKMLLSTVADVAIGIGDIFKNDLIKSIVDLKNSVSDASPSIIMNMISIQAEVIRLAMLLDKAGGSLTAFAAYATIPGFIVGAGAIPEKFAEWNKMFSDRYDENERSLMRLADQANKIEAQIAVDKKLKAELKSTSDAVLSDYTNLFLDGYNNTQTPKSQPKTPPTEHLTTQSELDKIQRAADKATESIRKTSEVTAELNSKIAAFEGESYASKISKIDVEYSKLAHDLKGANALLDEWKEKAVLEAGADEFQKTLDFWSKYRVSIENAEEKLAKLNMTATESSNYDLKKQYDEAMISANQFGDSAQRLKDILTALYNAQVANNLATTSKEIADASRKMYKDMGEDSIGYFAGEEKLLTDQAAYYKKIGADKDLVNQWLWNEEKKLNDKRVLMSDDFFAGMRIGYEDLQKDAMTWAKAGQKLIKDFASQGAASLSDGLFDIITGEMESLADAWKSLWQGMLKSMLDIVAQMAMNDVIKFVFGGTSTGTGITIGTSGTSGSSTGAGAIGTGVSAVSTLASAYKFLTSIPEYYATAASWIGSLGSTAETSVAAFEALEAALAKTATTAATSTAPSVVAAGSGSASAGAGAVAGYAGALFAVMSFVASDTFRNLYYGGTKTSYEVLREDERTGYAQLDPDMRDWLKADLLNSAAVNMGLQSIVKDFDTFVETHKELLSMTMDKFDYLLGEQGAFFASAVDTTGTNSNTLAGFTINYNSDASVQLAVDIANDAQLTLEEKMYQLGFIATASGGWETEAVVAMIAELSNDGVPWSKIQDTMNSYGVPTDGQSTYGMGGMATGGTYGNAPFIVGEKGWEIVDPRTKTVLSHEQSLKAMGMKGYADGTDPFLDLIGMANAAGEVGSSTSTSSGSSMTWEEFWADYEKAAMTALGYTTDLGDALDEINTTYEEQVKQAKELNASAEDLATMEAVRMAEREKAINDWAKSEKDYYDEMMGLNTDLGDSLSEIADHYKDAIANAQATGASQEQLDAIVAAGMAVGQKAVDDWSLSVYDYYNGIMGYTSSLQSALDANNAQWEVFIAAAIVAGASVEQLTALYAAQKETTDEINAQWAKDAISSLVDLENAIFAWAGNIAGMTKEQIALNELMVYRASKGFSHGSGVNPLDTTGMSDDQVKDYVGALTQYFNAVVTGLEQTYEALKSSQAAIWQSKEDILLSSKSLQEQSNIYLDRMTKGLESLSGIAAEDMPEAMNKVHDDLMKYYDLEQKSIKDRYQTWIDAEEKKHQTELQNIEAVRDKLESLTYSGYNLALPGVKAKSAEQDFNKLYAAAQTGDADSVSKFLNFTDTYLSQSQSAYKSSQKYLDIYDDVMKKIGSLDTQKGKSIEELTKEQTAEIEALNDAMEEELRLLDDDVVGKLDMMYKDLDPLIADVATEIGKIYGQIADIIFAAYDGNDISRQSMESASDFYNWFANDFTNGLYTWADIDTQNSTDLLNLMTAWHSQAADVMSQFAGYYLLLMTTWAGNYARYVAWHMEVWGVADALFKTWFMADFTTGLYTWTSAELAVLDRIASAIANIQINVSVSIPEPVIPTDGIGGGNTGRSITGYADGGWPSGPDSGYLAMLHGQEVVLSRPKAVSDVGDGQSDPEVKALLRTLIAAVQDGKIIQIDGKPIAQIADQNRVNAERRLRDKTRRII
jgi:TP901 family phage tail tape measure protein